MVPLSIWNQAKLSLLLLLLLIWFALLCLAVPMFSSAFTVYDLVGISCLVLYCW